MDHKHFNEYISPYLDQILDRQDREEFEEHLSKCPECKNELEETRRLIGIIKNLDEEPLPQGFDNNLYRRLKKDKGIGNKYWLKWIGAVASLVIIFFSIKAASNIGSMDGIDNMNKADMIAENAPLNQGTEKDMDEYSGGMDIYSQDSSEETVQDGTDQDEAAQKEVVRGEANQDEAAQSKSTAGMADSAETKGATESKMIESDIVEVYVQDVCITPQTLKFMAIDNELELVESDENSIVVKIIDYDQRRILFDELSKMGEIKEVGKKIETGRETNKETEGYRVKLIIKNKE